VSSAEEKIGQSTGKLTQPKGANAHLLAEVNCLTTSLSLTKRAEMRCGDRSLVVRQALGSDGVLVEDPRPGEIECLGVADIRPVTPEAAFLAGLSGAPRVCVEPQTSGFSFGARTGCRRAKTSSRTADSRAGYFAIENARPVDEYVRLSSTSCCILAVSSRPGYARPSGSLRWNLAEVPLAV